MNKEQVIKYYLAGMDIGEISEMTGLYMDDIEQIVMDYNHDQSVRNDTAIVLQLTDSNGMSEFISIVGLDDALYAYSLLECATLEALEEETVDGPFDEANDVLKKFMLA